LLELQPELAICTIAGTAASWTGSSSSKIDKQLEAILSQHPTTVSASAGALGGRAGAPAGSAGAPALGLGARRTAIM